MIDPTLKSSTYLAGSLSDSSSSICVNGDGEVLVAATTLSTDFPTTTGAYAESAPTPGTSGTQHDVEFRGVVRVVQHQRRAATAGVLLEPAAHSREAADALARPSEILGADRFGEPQGEQRVVDLESTRLPQVHAR